MATVLARPASVQTRATTPPPLSLNTTPRGAPAPVPNKHIPFCSPGPRPATRAQWESSPTSPPDAVADIQTSSLLHPPDTRTRLVSDPPIYGLNANAFAQACNHIATQPLPSPREVFPWLHGLHPDNHMQLAFFGARKRSSRRTPRCLRVLTVVKVGGDLSHSRLKGAVAADEILKSPEQHESAELTEDDLLAEFHDMDPPEGFGVRNFQIQTSKMATVSDIVVYADQSASQADVILLATKISSAQAAWQHRMEIPRSGDARSFNTFVLIDDYKTIEAECPDLVAVDSEGYITGKVMDFFQWERIEMCSMSAATEIARNVWLGPTPDPSIAAGLQGLPEQPEFDILIETSDMAQIPDSKTFAHFEDWLDKNGGKDSAAHQLEFPGSGAIVAPTWSHAEVDGLLEMCQWIHKQANGRASVKQRRDSKLSLSPRSTVDADGDQIMSDDSRSNSGRKILIHCNDGYTESSLLGLAYCIFAECVPVHEAWLQLHREKQRNFFAYSSDVHLLRTIQPRLMSASPKHSTSIQDLVPPVPEWLDRMDGSLPSRIMPYMYLGNLGHANNPGLLEELGIGQILSIGEPVSWSPETVRSWPRDNLVYIDKVQDNGVDPLTEEFGRCLEFIERGRKKGTATLVHCRVGVSRSATICIAEVMNELGLSFPRAYCFVRARRLNVIIQPHLQFSYELLKWEEFQCQKRGQPLRRELEWATIAREIAAMNRPYARQ